jgi:hypothetical protein
MSRRQAFLASGLERVVIVDRGNVEFALPHGWTAEPQRDGFMKCKDATDAVLLEVSYLRLSPLEPGQFPVGERLRLVMAEDAAAAQHSPIVTRRRGDVEIAWAEYVYECDDSERGERRPARGRWTLGSNQLFQVLLTYYYWADDTAWAVRAWEAIVETIRLGDGIPLETPKDHWSLRADS